MSSPTLETHTEPSPSVTLRMFFPTPAVSPTTSPVEGSRRVTVPLKLLVTQTKSLAGEQADRLVPHADRLADRGRPRRRSMRLTLSPSPFATHEQPAPS